MPQPLQYVRDGRLRALGVSTAKRLDVLPDVPSIGEFVPGYEAIGWSGVGAPKGTPAAVIDMLNAKIGDIVNNDPQMAARLRDAGILPRVMTPAEFGGFIADETEKWAKVIKFSNIKPE
jgi:tripartite-type tricarboxylate transporter receptor subunit TctC